MRPRAELAFLALALLIGIAFVVSFIFGIRDGRPAPSEPASAVDTGGAIAVPATRGRVEVLNGAGRTGLARRATERLRAGGFDVVFFGNAGGAPRDSSSVIDRVGREDIARSVADQLGIRSVTSEPDSTLYLDATVILGADWN